MFIIDYRTKQLVEQFFYDWMETGYNSVTLLLVIWLFLSQWHVTNVFTATVRHKLVVCLYWNTCLYDIKNDT